MVRLIPLVVVVALPAAASTVVAESIEEMAAVAPVVVHARVQAAQSAWDGEHRRIWTWTELKVHESLKGAAPTIILVKQPGGVVGGVGQAVSGAASFVIGEELVAFLEPCDEANVFQVRALSLGKVTFEQRAGQPRAVRTLEGLAFARPGASTLVAPPPGDLGTPEAFLARVRLAVRRGGR